ncbi:MAG TPA: sulfatase-like hydrolase/transferase [Bryobacteraceae bacterium]|nr:sulfatase-like hydrolase/transferase [Bryobacteraceae bacterium]
MYWLTLIELGALCGIVAAFVFRRLASPGIRQTVDRIQAHLMELWMFIDEPALVFRAQRDLLCENLRLFRQIALPLAITAPLFAVAVWQADAYLGRGPLPAGEPAVVTAHVKDGNVRLEAPPDIVIETPGVQIPRLHEISWRIRPKQAFSGHLSASGDVERIDIPWPQRPWRLWFFAISAISALLAPRSLGKRSAILVLLPLLVLPASAAEKPPVILISIDTLRADHLSAYGYTKAQTPNIDAFADGGTIFKQIDAQVPLTLPSHASLMTSMVPFENRVEVNGDVVPPGAVTLASVLRANGYQTAAFVGSMVMDRRFGLDQGFEVYDSPFGSQRVRRDAALVTRAALAWLEKNRAQPAFAFLHLYDLHTPYTLPEVAGLTPTVTGYDAELQYVDRMLGRFHELLAGTGLWDKALVIVLADHGESLGDHGETSHGYFAYESTLHVPLIVHWPGGSQRFPKQINESGGLIDVAPTILEFLHFPVPPSFEGVSLLPGHGEHAVFSESVYPREAFGWAPLHVLRLGQWKYIDAPRAELYDLSKDPAERANVFSTQNPAAQSLKSQLGDLIARHGPKPSSASSEVSARTRAVLGSLGYTAGGRAKNGKPPADPKDKVAESEAYEGGLALLYSSQYDKAIRAFSRIVTEDGQNLPALCALGEAYLRSGNTTRALGLWQQALEKDPQYQPAADSIGEYWLAQKNFEKACRFVPATPECAGRK